MHLFWLRHIFVVVLGARFEYFECRFEFTGLYTGQLGQLCKFSLLLYLLG